MRTRLPRQLATALIAASLGLVAFGPLAALAPGALAQGNGWQNGNGTSSTATGEAGTGQAARVFAFNAGVPVIACSSPQGVCKIGIPDGPNSFEIFVNPGMTKVEFTVTTSSPIGCGAGIAFKARDRKSVV